MTPLVGLTTDLINGLVPFDLFVEVIGKSSLILVLALGLVMIGYKYSSAIRFSIIGLAILGTVILPAVIMIIPDWQVDALPPLSLVVSPDNHIQLTDGSTQFGAVTTDVSPLPSRVGLEERHISWRSWLPLVWAAGAVAMAGWFAMGRLAVWHIMRRAVPLPGRERHRLFTRCKALIGCHRNVRLFNTHAVSVPFTVGVIRPCIILPASAQGWPRARLKAVLLHELAHIKRQDVFFARLVQVAAALYWFNPLFWTAARRLTVEREQACDDCVLLAGVRDVDYAQHLLEIGKSLRNVRRLVLPVVGMAHSLTLGDRIMKILDRKKVRHTAMSLGGRLMAAMAVLLVLPLASITGHVAGQALTSVTAVEKDQIMQTLTDFYEALQLGRDYDLIRDRFLSVDYFDRETLTLESLDRGIWRPVFDNTRSLIQDRLVWLPRFANAKVTGIRRVGDQCIVTQIIDIPSKKLKAGAAHRTADGITIRLSDPQTGETNEEECFLVKALKQEIVLTKEDSLWRIAQFDDGLSLMQMDTDNPYGPIFLIWVDDLGSDVTPYGPFVNKIVPRDDYPERLANIDIRLTEE